MKKSHLTIRSINVTWLPNNRYYIRASLLLIWLLLSVVSLSQAQLYYVLNDGSATTTTDQIRRINLDGSNDVLIRDNFIQSPGTVVLDAANNRLLIADLRVSQPSTSLTNTKIVAVSLAPGNAVSTLITPAYITGSTSTQVSGMAIDRINNYLYYVLNDGSATTTTDQIRRINLDGSNDVLIRDNFIQSPGTVVLDAANNRLLIADLRVSQPSTSLTNTKIVAVSLAPGNAVSTLVVPSYITGSTSTQVSGMAIDRINNYLYYVLNDGSATTTTDQIRRINLDGSNDVLIRDNFIQSPGTVVLDAANNRLLIADLRVSQPSTSLTNTKIVAVSLAPGNAVSTLIPPAYITGSTSTQVSGMAITNQDPPTVTTNAITSFGSSSAVLGGNVTSDGNVPVTERGVVYSSTNTLPTKANSPSLAIGSSTGGFSAIVNGLNGNTTYYVRAYATNAITTSYGAVQTFKTLIPNSAPTNITLTPSSVAENQPTSTTVGSFSSTDPDAGQTFTYALVSGSGSDDNASFQIVGNQLRTNAVFNFEAKSSYAIRVQTTDNGTPNLSFSKAFTITITNVNELVATVNSQTNVSCNGGANGAATLTATGENPPFSYSYRNTTTNTTLAQNSSAVSGLTAGVYSVTVTASSSGFTATTSFTISQPPALSLTTAHTNVGKLGASTGTASVTVSGGTPTYSYDWSPGNPPGDGTSAISSLSAGTYSVKVSDANGCSATASTSVGTDPDLTLLLYARPTVVYGSSSFSVVVDVIETNGVSTSGVVTVKVSKDMAATLGLNGSLTRVDNRSVQNSQWSLSSETGYYVLTSSQSIGGNGKLSFGLTGSLNASSTTGMLTSSATVMGGGESYLLNNIDSDKIEYFQQ